MFHKFSENIAGVSLPQKFNNPFRYTPHQLCLMAADEVRNYINSRGEWCEELAKGKMFGVLIVSTPEGEIGYLSAYSGLLAGDNKHPFFVPPIYDLLSKESYFQDEEKCISQINRQIEDIKKDTLYKNSINVYNHKENEINKRIEMFKELIKQNKIARDAKRKELQLSQSEQEQLIKESQFDKAELKRIIERGRDELAKEKKKIEQFSNQINLLKEERKQRSSKLQEWLFKQFCLYNAKGEVKDLIEIFSTYATIFPPAGAGECAAPKMLQYAYQNNLKPIQMAEFWVGASPIGEIRVDGNFYPSCKGKCLPILTYMLEGLHVEDTALCNKHIDTEFEVLYEDEYLLAINKPAGILSASGKIPGKSVEELMQGKNPNLKVIHRLDMATSGVLLLAKNIQIYKTIQSLFAIQKVEKTYIAIVEGEIQNIEGEITLPLSPDYENRPAQKVDFENGKPAITQYKVLHTCKDEDKKRTHILLKPITGRTHQLRVHLAHPKSLGTPIVGDELYGTPADRLMLHALSVRFIHPITHQAIYIETPSPF